MTRLRVFESDAQKFNRRAFLRDSTMGLGAMALSSLLNEGRAEDVD